MKYITATDTNTGEEVRIAYSDYGNGKPVILIHGWPLSREMWEYQLEPLINAGLRVIKYDRRGFGKSDKPWNGYDYDTFAADLKALIDQLDLREVTLVGFSMGGGEIARYISRYGKDRVAKVVLVAAITPFLLKTENNPDGVDPEVFTDMIKQVKEDRIGFLDGFGKKFFGVNLISKPVSEKLLDYYIMLASHATQRSTEQCVIAFSESDFRKDVKSISIPALIIHGDKDKIVPKEVSGDRLAELLPHAEYKVYEDAPHGLFYTHKDELNEDLVNFIAGHTGETKGERKRQVTDITV